MTMSNPLKRVMNPVEEVDDATPYQQEIWQYFGTFPDTPRQSQYHGPSYMNPGRYGNNTDHSSRALLNNPATFPLCSQRTLCQICLAVTILLDPSVSNQTSLMNLDEADYNLASELSEWGNSMALPNFDSSQLTPISFQENSPSPSVTPESTQLRAKSVTSADDEETICYGMVSGHCSCLSLTSLTWDTIYLR